MWGVEVKYTRSLGWVFLHDRFMAFISTSCGIFSLYMERSGGWRSPFSRPWILKNGCRSCFLDSLISLIRVSVINALVSLGTLRCLRPFQWPFLRKAVETARMYGLSHHLNFTHRGISLAVSQEWHHHGSDGAQLNPAAVDTQVTASVSVRSWQHDRQIWKVQQLKGQCVSFYCGMKCHSRENINSHILVYVTHKGKEAEFGRMVLMKGGANLHGWKKTFMNVN